MAFKAAQAVVALVAKVLPLHPKRAKHHRQQAPQLDHLLLQLGDALDDLSPAPGPPPPPRHPQASRPVQLDIGRASECEQRERTERQVGGKALHAWGAIGGNPGTWRCKVCGKVADTGQPHPPSPLDCLGFSNVLDRVGCWHRLVIYPPPV